MAYGEEPSHEKTVRRQVMLTIRCVIDVPIHMDEDAVQFLVEEHHCHSDLIMSLAEQIAYDDAKGECNVCVHAEAKLVPVSEEVKSNWLNNLPPPVAFGDEEDDEEDLEDTDEDDEDEKEEPLK